MNLQELEAFYYIAKEKSFHKAAEILHITQPAISTRIKKLESTLNADLFYREGRKIHLTQYGKIFKPYAQKILTLIHDSTRTIDDFRNSEYSRIEIGTTSRISTYFLPDLLETFQTVFPNIEIMIQTDISENIKSLLQNDSVHIGLINDSINDTGYVQIPAIHDEICLVTSPQHPLYQKYLINQAILLTDITSYTIINFNRTSTYYQPIVELLKENHIFPKQNIAVDNIEAMKRMVSKKIGIAFLPKMAIQREIQEHALVHIPLHDYKTLDRKTYIIYKKKTYINPAINSFISVLNHFLEQG